MINFPLIKSTKAWNIIYIYILYVACILQACSCTDSGAFWHLRGGISISEIRNPIKFKPAPNILQNHYKCLQGHQKTPTCDPNPSLRTQNQ